MRKQLSITIIHDPGTKDAKGNERRDPAVNNVADALSQKGHRLDFFAVPDQVGAFVEGLQARKPDLVFNLAESFADSLYNDHNIAALLEVMHVPFTGASAGGLYLSQDKILTKKLLAFHGVKYPPFVTLAPNYVETAGRIGFPLLVKPARADASLGIHASSVVTNFKALMERVQYIHDVFGAEALCEQYIEGREYYVSVIGHLEPQILSVVELDFSGLPPGAAKVLSYDAKWNRRTRAFKGTKSVLAENLSPELEARLRDAGREAYLAMRLRDYGRVDVRVSPGGEIYVIEVNPNPYLAKESEFAMAAAGAGMAYEDVVDRIAEMAWKRRRERSPAITEVLAGSANTSRVTPASPIPTQRPAKASPETKVIEEKSE